MAKPVTVMLLFGGESSEHTVSISSARNVYAALDETKFEVILTYIDKTGKWWLLDNLEQASDISEAPELTPVLGESYFMIIPGVEKIEPDVILPILHGENGEDGTIQGLARLIHLPIVGCDVSASVICMDKVLTKQILESNGIKTVPYVVHVICEPLPQYETLTTILSDTLFIKPAGCGSSVGVNKAKSQSDLVSAISEAHKYDKKVLIEKAIKARELEVAMFGSGTKAKASVVGEIIPDSEFYDFESKYSATSQSRVIIPADLTQELSEKIRLIATKAYQIVGGEGLARVDFFLDENSEVFLNEINTLPGFTNISMYPKLWRHSGMTYSELIEGLIYQALSKSK